MVGTTNFPGSLDSHSGADPFGFGAVANGVATALTALHSASVTTFDVEDTTNFPTRGTAVCDDEVITYTGTSGGNQLTGVTRGTGGTTAAAHLDGALVVLAPVAAHHDDLAAAVVAVETAVPALLGSAQTTSTASASISFTGLSTRFSRFEVSVSGRQESTAVANLLMQINGDTGANYHYLQRLTTSTVQANTEAFASTGFKVGEMPSSTAPAAFAGSFVAQIAHPASTWAKNIRSEFVSPFATSSGSLRTGDLRGFWSSTASATRLDIVNAGGNFSSGVVARLIGYP